MTAAVRAAHRRAPALVTPLLALALVAGGRGAAAQAVPTSAPVAAATVATASDAALLAEAEPRLVSALDATTRSTVAAALGEARRGGLPVEPLVAKALEGVEKGAPAPRIGVAVRALLARLGSAQSALAPVASQAELIAGADALAAGVPPSVLRRVRAASPNRSAAVALGVLAQLVSRGVPPARAAEAVTGLLRRGALPPQLLALDGAVQADVAAGVPAATALDARVSALVNVLPLVPPRVIPSDVINTGTPQGPVPTSPQIPVP